MSIGRLSQNNFATGINDYYGQQQQAGAQPLVQVGQAAPQVAFAPAPPPPSGSAMQLTPQQAQALQMQRMYAATQPQAFSQAAPAPTATPAPPAPSATPSPAATAAATVVTPPLAFPPYPPQGATGYAEGAFAASALDPYAGFLVGKTGAPVFTKSASPFSQPTLYNSGTIASANGVVNEVDNLVFGGVFAETMANNYAGKGNQAVALIPKMDGVSGLTWQGNIPSA